MEGLSITGEPLFLKAGVHSLVLASERYKEISTGFSIEPGQTFELALELEDLAPEVYFDLQPDTELFVDGVKRELSGEEDLNLEEGEHTFLVKVGAYSTSRTLFIQNGKTYNISIFFDFDIKED